MRAGHRKLLLSGILIGLVAFVLWDSAPSREASRAPSAAAGKAEPARAGAPEAARGPGDFGLALPERSALGEVQAELFGAQSWRPPAPKTAPPPPAAPTAPPMPYRIAGRLVQDGQLQVFLSKGDTPIAVKQGQVLDGTYRVDSVTVDRVTLTYLPLDQKETISAPTLSLPAGAQAGIGRIPAESVVGSSGAPAQPALREAAAPAAAEGKSDGKSARLLWDGPQQVKVGADFSVALRVTSDQPVRASPMQFRFDPSLLASVAVKPGRFYEQSGRNFSYHVNPAGVIFVGASKQGPVPASDAEFLVLTFRPLKAAPVAELSIASLNLQGAAGRTIAFDQVAAFKTAITP